VADININQLREFTAKLSSLQLPKEVFDEWQKIIKDLEALEQTHESNHKKLLEQMAHSARITELGLMAASLFHEMNQPLLGIKGFAELALSNIKSGPTEKLNDFISQIHTQAVRLQELQRIVVNFFRRENISNQSINLKLAVDEVMLLFQHKLRKHKIKLGLVIPEDLPLIDINPTHLNQILINLIGNALDAMEGKKDGSLRLSAIPAPATKMIRILVADSGVGISEDIRDRLFEPFFSTKGDKGTGLGLYISQTLAQNSQGQLDLLDASSLGWQEPPATVFEVQLPQAAEEPSQPDSQIEDDQEDESDTSESLQVNKAAIQLNRELEKQARKLEISQRVLIVDDEPVIQRVLAEVLAQHEILCDVTTSAEEAVERIKAKEYAVLLTDKNLPGIDGIQLMKVTKKESPRTETLVITGYASVTTALEAIKEGAFDYITKPFPDLNYIAEKVKSALARHDFEVRIFAMIEALKQISKKILGVMKQDQQADWVKKLKDALSKYNQQENSHVIFVGTASLAREAEKIGYRVTQASDIDAAKNLIEDQEVQVVVFAEKKRTPIGHEVITAIHEINPNIGVFIISHESNLKNVISAISNDVGDYMVRPIDNLDIFGARLKRLVSRQQRITKYNLLLSTLKNMNIDLMARHSQQKEELNS
jgi:signal transduction histidine kinase/DNA-binding response OmpR family regulator